MDTLSVSEARNALGDLMNKVVFGHERIIIERRGRDRVALVPIEDVELLEELENRADLDTIRERMAETSRPLDEIVPELGL